MYIYYTYVYMYTKAFLLHLIKAWERATEEWSREVGKHKLNEMRALNMK